MAIDYQSAESWSTSTDNWLPSGNWVVNIDNAETSETSNNNPQIELDMSNSSGMTRAWVVITANSVGKVVQLFDAVGVDRPKDGEFDPNTGALTTACVQRLVGKQVGVVIRDEPSYKDPTKMLARVQGFVSPSEVGGNGAPGQQAATTATSRASDEVPF